MDLTALYHRLLPKRALTDFAGWMANLRTPLVKNYLIADFIQRYGVDMTEALEPDPTQYACFNEFFIRPLNPVCRPIAQATVVSPVDGRISQWGYVSEGRILQAKGRWYSVPELLADEPAVCERFRAASFATLYLSPKDYHRVHMPIEGVLRGMTYVPGRLFSVQPSTVNAIPNLFARNERLVVHFDTAVGPLAMVLVGATIVGAMGTVWEGDLPRGSQLKRYDYPEQRVFPKAAEMGYFKLGSTVILLFADGKKLPWNAELSAGDELRLGQRLAEA